MRMRIVEAIGLFSFVIAIPAGAQDFLIANASAAVTEQVVQKPEGAPPTPEHTGIKAILKGLVTDFENLPSKENALWVGIGSGLGLAVHPADDHLNAHLAGSTAHKIFVPGEIAGESATLLGVAATVYAVGRLKDEPKVSHVGMDLIRSLAVSEALTQALKYTVRRERPDGSGRNSFPSGHAADTFAFATALERHLGWRGAIPVYLVSSYVAASRLQDNRHFASDVVVGAAVGVIAGRTVTRHGHSQYSADVQFVPGGAALMFSRHAN
jgi:hypothetical protein